MSSYRVKTDDQTHVIEAFTHTRDSNGLTLLTDGGKAIAMFPTFSWMVIATQPEQKPAEEEAPVDESSTQNPALDGA